MVWVSTPQSARRKSISPETTGVPDLLLRIGEKAGAKERSPYSILNDRSAKSGSQTFIVCRVCHDVDKDWRFVRGGGRRSGSIITGRRYACLTYRRRLGYLVDPIECACRSMAWYSRRRAMRALSRHANASIWHEMTSPAPWLSLLRLFPATAAPFFSSLESIRSV